MNSKNNLIKKMNSKNNSLIKKNEQQKQQSDKNIKWDYFSNKSNNKESSQSIKTNNSQQDLISKNNNENNNNFENFKFKENSIEEKLIPNNIDRHSQWDDIKELEDNNILPKKIDDYINSVVKDSVKILKNKKKDIGNIPGYLSELIENILSPPKLPYYRIIEKLVKGSKQSKFKLSSTKINRKRSYVFLLENKDNTNKNIPIISPFPGKTRDFSFKILILIDTSMSMTKDDMMEALLGVKNIIEHDNHCDVTVIENDTRIVKEYKIKRLDDIDLSFKGRGGTRLKPGLERGRELKVDICLVFTDGYTENINNFDRRLLPKKIIWVIPNNGIINK